MVESSKTPAFLKVQEAEKALIPENITVNKEQPEAEFEIEFVHGYRTQDCNQNCRYTADGKIVWMTAALGVVLDPATGKQHYYGGKQVAMSQKGDSDDSEFHRDDILSIDLSADRKTVVTGQAGKSPSVHVWNPEDQTKICSFNLDKQARGVAAVSISSCGRYVAAVDLSNDHKVTIYNIERQKQLMVVEGSKERLFDVAWSKRADDLRFATVGAKTIKFWHPADITKKLNQTGTFGKATMTNMTSVAFDEEGWCYTGGENGHIQVWSDACTVVKQIKAHTSMVTGVVAEKGYLLSGGKDKKIAIISTAGGNFKLEKFIDLASSFVQSLDLFNGNLVVGLKNGSIIEYKDVLQEETKEPLTHMQSHHSGEVWGLEIVDDKHCLTCGDDNRIMLWHHENHTAAERIGKVSDHKPKNAAKVKGVTSSSQSIYPPNQQARAIAYSSKHGHIAVASNMGKVSIREFADFDKKVGKGLKDAQEWCEVVRYSPCQKYLATGSHDNHVYVYSIEDDGTYKLYKSFNKHSSYVQALDWSQDSSYIRSASGDYEKLYFNIADKVHDPAGAQNTKELAWATQTVKLGWDVLGIHPKGEDGTHINGVNISHDRTLLATSDDFGLINVYNYPVLSNEHQARSYAGHSEHVLRAAFSPDGTKLFSIGGGD